MQIQQNIIGLLVSSSLIGIEDISFVKMLIVFLCTVVINTKVLKTKSCFFIVVK